MLKNIAEFTKANEIYMKKILIELKKALLFIRQGLYITSYFKRFL